jgi:hypothetical protein
MRFSDAAAERVKQLLAAKVLPVHVSPRVGPMVQLAVQALCSRDTLKPEQFAGAYVAFESFVPIRSLPAPMQDPRRGGA